MNQLPLLSCDGCGACCMSMGYPRFFWSPQGGAAVDAIWHVVPDELKQELENYIEASDHSQQDQPCIWFNRETLKCNHYEYRPQLCRDFEIGNPHCLRMRIDVGLDT